MINKTAIQVYEQKIFFADFILEGSKLKEFLLHSTIRCKNKPHFSPTKIILVSILLPPTPLMVY